MREVTMKVLDEVFAERQRQDCKWGQQNHYSFKWLTILGEEYGEACKAAIENKAMEYRAELIHVAAVAVSAIESFDREVPK